MTLEMNFIASVAERDVDLVVMEEFSVNEEFRDWFSARAYGASIYANSIGAWHSVSDPRLGETDILVVFESDSGQRIALLIENKISAPPQPEQGARYRLRGEKGVKDGYWEEFKTCAIAPKRYLESLQHTESYDCEISYEELLAFYSSRRFRDARYGYKARIIQEAIEQNRRGYQPKSSEEMTSYVAAYFERYGKRFPDLKMQEPKPRPSGSDWIAFVPVGMPKAVTFYHQLTTGKVKVYFQGGAERFEELCDQYGNLLGPNMELILASKSAAISIAVPKVNPLESAFSEDSEKIGAAVEGIRQLVELIQNNPPLIYRGRE